MVNWKRQKARRSGKWVSKTPIPEGEQLGWILLGAGTVFAIVVVALVHAGIV
jgi:hypothetical protein